MCDENELARLLRAMEERLFDPNIRALTAEVSPMIAGEFREFGRSGLIYDKAETIAGLSGEPRSPTVERWLRDFRVQLLAEGAALVTYGSIRRLTDGTELWSLRSSIWIWCDPRWQMMFHQGTPAPQPQPPWAAGCLTHPTLCPTHRREIGASAGSTGLFNARQG